MRYLWGHLRQDHPRWSVVLVPVDVLAGLCDKDRAVAMMGRKSAAGIRMLGEEEFRRQNEIPDPKAEVEVFRNAMGIWIALSNNTPPRPLLSAWDPMGSLEATRYRAVVAIAGLPCHPDCDGYGHDAGCQRLQGVDLLFSGAGEAVGVWRFLQASIFGTLADHPL